jgi:hypothetical protein
MQINHFLPFFLCSVNLIFNKLYCHSPLPLSVQQVCSASHSSVILLFFCSDCCSALFLLYISSLSTHLLRFHTTHLLISSFLLFRSFSIQNSQPNSVSLILFYTHTLMVPLHLPIGNPRTLVLATEMIIVSYSRICFV